MSLVRYRTHTSLSAGEKDGVAVRRLAGEAGEVRFVFAVTPHTATDRSSFYNGDRYHWGTLTSPVHETTTRFDTLLPSWNATTPGGTWVQLEVRVRSAGTWTPWFNMGVWTSETSLERHSVNGQEAEGWRVLTDTLQSSARLVFAGAYQYRLTLFTDERDLSPRVRSLSFAISDSRCHGQSSGTVPLRAVWGDSLPVPARSQMVYPNGGEAWCSPTSLSMVVAYWARATWDGSLDQSVPAVADGVYDHSYGGWGNWSFNVAYASSHGLEAAVGRMGSVEQVERWIGAGIPVVASVAWDNDYAGQRLSGAPLQRSDGHLLVIRGFTVSGDVIVNDPAGRGDADVPRVYEKAEFSRAWLRNPGSSGGVVYLIHPPGWRAPNPCDAKGV